jgi:hypothetical protein
MVIVSEGFALPNYYYCLLLLLLCHAWCMVRVEKVIICLTPVDSCQKKFQGSEYGIPPIRQS